MSTHNIFVLISPVAPKVARGIDTKICHYRPGVKYEKVVLHQLVEVRDAI